MRILHLSSVPPPHDAAGTAARTALVVASLRSLGHEVATFEPTPAGVTPTDPLAVAWAARRDAQTWLDGRRGDLAVFAGVWEGVAALAWAKACGARTIWDVSSFPSIDLPARYPELLRRPGRVEALILEERTLLETSDRLLAPTRTAAHHLLRAGVTGKRISVVPDAVDTDLLRPAVVAAGTGFPRRATTTGSASQGRRTRVSTTGSVRTRTGSQTTGRRGAVLRLLCRGERIPSAALVPLLHAMATAGRRGRYDLTVVSAAQSGWRGQCRALARRLGVEKDVHVTTTRDPGSLVRLLQSIHVCVAPLPDDLPASVAGRCPPDVLEAMAAGIPLLATRIAPVEELVEHGVSAHLVEPGSAAALAAGLAWMADHPVERADLASKARAAVVAGYTATRFRERIAEALSRTISRRTPRAARGS